MMKLSEELTWRGFVNQTTFKDISALDGQSIKFYWGVDPSADSMTIGNLAAAMMVKTLMRHGHKAVLLVGGATGMIGDPDGKSEERNLLSPEQLARNKQAITGQYRQVFGEHGFEIVDNYDWFKDFKYLDFLRDVGKHVPMRQMLAREFVQKRLGEGGSGISYAEFSYVLIQAYDFLYLYKNKGVTLQVCGSDQWGNSVAGVDLIRRETGGEAHVYSSPLIVDKTTGQKFGKTEAGAIWLDDDKTTPFQFYQFWLNVDDESVESYLKIFTELDKPEIDDLMQKFNENKSARLAQKTLAFEATKLVHGKAMADKVVWASDRVISEEPIIKKEDFKLIADALGTVPTGRFLLVEIIVELGLAESRTEARRFLDEQAIFINNVRVTDKYKTELSDEDIHDDLVVIRRGKNMVAVGDVS